MEKFLIIKITLENPFTKVLNWRQTNKPSLNKFNTTSSSGNGTNPRLFGSAPEEGDGL